jgi:hypothetical protein
MTTSPSTSPASAASTKMALLKREAVPIEQIEEAIALSDERLRECFPGCLDHALAVRERYRSNGDRIPRGPDGRLVADGMLVVTLATQAVIEVEGQRIMVEDLDDVRTETRLREVATMIGRSWAGQALIDWRVENWTAIITFTKRNGPKGATEQILELLLEGEEDWSPALLLSWKFTRREAMGLIETPDYLLPEVRQEIEQAIAEGEREIQRTEAAFTLLKQGEPEPSPFHIPGF